MTSDLLVLTLLLAIILAIAWLILRGPGSVTVNNNISQTVKPDDVWCDAEEDAPPDTERANWWKRGEQPPDWEGD